MPGTLPPQMPRYHDHVHHRETPRCGRNRAKQRGETYGSAIRRSVSLIIRFGSAMVAAGAEVESSPRGGLEERESDGKQPRWIPYMLREAVRGVRHANVFTSYMQGDRR